MSPERSSPARALADTGREETLLKWSSALWQRRPKTFIVGILAVVLGLGGVWFGFSGQGGAVILAAALLGGALGQLYLPTTYTLTTKKVYQQVFFSRDGYRWTDFDDFRIVEDGVYLHLRPTDMRARYLKGLTLFFGRANREQVLDIVRQNVPSADALAKK